MKILTLSKGESFSLTMPDGRKVTVAVTAFDSARKKVRLGIAADRSIPVHRQEVQEEIEAARERGGLPA